MERQIVSDNEFVLTEDIDVGRLHIPAGTHGLILERDVSQAGYWVTISRISRVFVHDFEMQMI